MTRRAAKAADPKTKKAAEKSAEVPFTDPVFVVRTCNPDLTSYNGFQWNGIGEVTTAPDFDPKAECGNGLHGLLEGDGDWGLLDWSIDAKAMVVETDRSQLVEIGGKVKFRSGIVRQIGCLAKLLCERLTRELCNGDAIRADVASIEATSATDGSADDYVAAASGYGSKLAASGYGSKLAASGDDSQLAASGYGSKLAASGDGSQLAASGEKSIVAGIGCGSVASAGPNGCIALAWWDEDAQRRRVTVGYIGEEGLEADVPYRLDSDGKFVRAGGGA